VRYLEGDLMNEAEAARVGHANRGESSPHCSHGRENKLERR